MHTDAYLNSCNFDSDFCNYSPNQFMTRYTGKSPSLTSGPSADKTTGNIRIEQF